MCPWDAFDPGTVAFCEERLCAWVVEPSNTWSSLAYVVVGGWLLADASRARDPRLGVASLAEILIGLGSIAFHGTGTFVGELLDQAGMFMLSCLILSFAAARAWRWSPSTTALAYVGSVIASTALLLVVRPAGIPLFAVQLATGLGWELVHRSRSAEPATFLNLQRGILIFLAAFAVWITDITGLLCAPTNHLLTGHAVWHLLNAASIERLYRFYALRFGR
ncbi:MAG: ceramidase domain-containing protein [Alphaproteobacteria bacterium]|nr:ceramidase domain-containing protein [Alphaproteobacteria bacterium]MCB9698812.1 ceramidase domain-containing protein [Alphaproteobacteria bacterium]